MKRPSTYRMFVSSRSPFIYNGRVYVDNTNPKRFIPYCSNETLKSVQELVGKSERMKFLPNCRSYFLMNFILTNRRQMKGVHCE